MSGVNCASVDGWHIECVYRLRHCFSNRSNNRVSISASLMAATAAVPNNAGLRAPASCAGLDAVGICRNQLIEQMGRQRIDRRIVEHQRGAQRPLDTEVLAEQIAKLHRHQRIKTQIHEAIVAIRRLGRIEPENLNHALAHEVAHEIETIRRQRIEDALAK